MEKYFEYYFYIPETHKKYEEIKQKIKELLLSEDGQNAFGAVLYAINDGILKKPNNFETKILDIKDLLNDQNKQDSIRYKVFDLSFIKPFLLDENDIVRDIAQYRWNKSNETKIIDVDAELSVLNNPEFSSIYNDPFSRAKVIEKIQSYIIPEKIPSILKYLTDAVDINNELKTSFIKFIDGQNLHSLNELLETYPNLNWGLRLLIQDKLPKPPKKELSSKDKLEKIKDLQKKLDEITNIKKLNNFNNFGISKYADIPILDSLVNLFKNQIQTNIDEIKKDPINGILNLAVPAVITAAFGPIAGIIFTIISEVFGIDYHNIFNNLRKDFKDLITGKKETKEKITDEEIKSKINGVVDPAFASSKDDPSKLNKLLTEYLPQLKKTEASLERDEIVKNAILGATLVKESIKNVFKKMLFGTFKSLFKSVSVGAAATAVGEHKSQKGGDSIGAKPAYQFKTSSNIAEYEEYHKNDLYASWIINTSPNNIKNTIISWVTSIYPELKGHENLITSSSKFNDLLSKFKKENPNTSVNQTDVPNDLTSKKQIVDYFIEEVGRLYAKST